ncbi:MAG: hypothetical protein NWR36_03350, partial [Opitutales bacterium]|nr:hypothetical protein [Opitutales bacterium]
GRLIADRMSYDTQNSTFSVNVLRTGQWPYYISGVNAGGSTDEMEIEGATVYYGNPSPFGLNVSSEKVEYISGENERVKMHGATFRIGDFPFFYFPSYTYYVGTSPYYLDINGGMDSQL